MREKTKSLLLFLLPAFAPLFAFGIYPLVYAIYLSFNFVNLRSTITPFFYGFGNFSDLVSSGAFQGALIATGIFAGLLIPLLTLMTLGEALLLSKTFRGVKILQVLAIVPWGIPPVITSGFFRFAFDLNFGLFNALAVKLGLASSYVGWLAQPWTAMGVIVLSFLWVQSPLPTLLFLAGLQSIPKELYEAAEIDGAKSFARFRAVTFNWLRPVFFIVVVFITITSLWAFDEIYVITQGGPGEFTKTITYFTFETMFNSLNFGQAGAASFLTLIISVVLIYLYFRALRLGRLRLRV